MARVLVIDDDRESRETLEEQLRRAGHGVQTSATATDGMRMARERRPDVVLLDAELPDMTTAGVVRALGGEMAMRAINQEEVIAGEGAADSLCKPFSVKDVLARIEAALKRARPEVDPTKPIEFGILRVDRDAQRVWVAAAEVTL